MPLSSQSRSTREHNPFSSTQNVVPHTAAWHAPDAIGNGAANTRRSTASQPLAGPDPHLARAGAEMEQLLRDLSWFSERAADLATPETEGEQRLLSRYLQLIDQRRSRLLSCRWASMLQSGRQQSGPQSGPQSSHDHRGYQHKCGNE